MWEEEIVEARRILSEELKKIRTERHRLDAYWSKTPTGSPPIPPRDDLGDIGTSGTAAESLAEWLNAKVDEWDRPPRGTAGGPTALYRQALQVASIVFNYRNAIIAVAGEADRAGGTATDRDALHRNQVAVDPNRVERNRLGALCRYLFATDPAEPNDRHGLFRRMLKLDIVQLAFAGASQDVEQEVELVQLCARDPQTLTGVQLHHFGAFYRSSWRMNDWLRGRMDGAAHLVRTLMSVERLRERAVMMPASDEHTCKSDPDVVDLFYLLEKAALAAADDDDQRWLAKKWAEASPDCAAFMRHLAGMPPAAGQTGPPTEQDPSRWLKTCVEAVLRPIHLRILREDLPALAEAVRGEGNDCLESSRAWLDAYDAKYRATQGRLTASHLWELWEASGKIGRERIAEEVGSDTFARTAAHGAASVSNTVGSPTKPKSVSSALGAVRGYTLAVWAMVTFLTSTGRFGPRVVEIAVAVGAALLAVTIIVPGIPLGLTLVGVLLLLAGFSAAGLLTRGARRVGFRLALCAAIVVVALAVYLYRDYVENGLGGIVGSGLAKVGVVLLIVLLGWWVSRVGGRGTWSDGRIGGRAGAETGEAAGWRAGRDAGGRAGEIAGAEAGGNAGAAAAVGGRDARKAGAEAGKEAGRKAGLEAGERAGFNAGRKRGRAAGREAGRRAGEHRRSQQPRGRPWRRWNEVRDDSKAVHDVVQKAASEAGRKLGKQAGEQAGRDAGKAAGAITGRRAGTKAGKAARSTTIPGDAIARTKCFEGSISHMYLDTAGAVAVGVGHIMPTADVAARVTFLRADNTTATAEEVKAEFAVIRCNGKGKLPSFYKKDTRLHIADATIDTLLSDDLGRVVDGLTGELPGFATYPVKAQEALVDMAFNLGLNGLMTKFPKFIELVKRGDWKGAAGESRRNGISNSRNEGIKTLLTDVAAT